MHQKVYLMSIINRNMKCAIWKDKVLLWLSRVLAIWIWCNIKSATAFENNKNLFTRVPVNWGARSRCKCLKPYFNLFQKKFTKMILYYTNRLKFEPSLTTHRCLKNRMQYLKWSVFLTRKCSVTIDNKSSDPINKRSEHQALHIELVWVKFFNKHV
jgi:hypothetical protein